MLLTGQIASSVDLITPKGVALTLDVTDAACDHTSARCAVRNAATDGTSTTTRDSAAGAAHPEPTSPGNATPGAVSTTSTAGPSGTFVDDGLQEMRPILKNKSNNVRIFFSVHLTFI